MALLAFCKVLRVVGSMRSEVNELTVVKHEMEDEEEETGKEGKGSSGVETGTVRVFALYPMNKKYNYHIFSVLIS